MAAASRSPPFSIPNNGESSGGDAVDFSTALTVWRAIRLPELQHTLNQTAPSLLEAQKVALVNRKKLAEQTRDFKKQPDDHKLEAVRPLLKAYQAEIDTLTQRSKTAENAFLNVHSALTTAPDPYPLLELVLEQAASLNDLETTKQDNGRLLQENAQLKSATVQNQEDQNERQRLHERVQQLQQSFESRLQEQTETLEKQIAAKWDERLRNLQERERDLTNTLHLAQEQLQELKTRDESTTARLLSQGQEDDERETRGKLAEIELLTRDLERAQTRASNVERRNEQLREEIETVKSGQHQRQQLEAMTLQLGEKDQRISQLQTLVEEERQQLERQREQANRASEERNKLQREKDAEIQTLNARLGRCADYDEIKRELEIVKMVEFSNEYDDDADDGRQTLTAASASATGTKSLEALLLEKNRKLSDQLTSLRVAHDELSSSSSTSSTEVTRLKKEVARLRSLNEKLENDLVSVGSGEPIESGTAANGAKTASAAIPATSAAVGSASASMSAEEALAELDRIGATAAPSSPITSTAAASSSRVAANGTAPRAPPIQAAGQADHSILPIITSQRDRFRSRNAELEEELRRQFETISELRVEIKTLQADNLGLYEKLRYLQTYGSASSAADGSVKIGMGYPPTEREGRRSADEKYRTRYEESMNPFEQFRGREQTRALSSLNLLERLLHMLTKLVLSHRRMRLLFMGYAIFLHALVFGMMVEVGHSSSGNTCAIGPDTGA